LKDLGFVYIATVMMSKLSIITTLEEERALAAKWAKAKVNDTLQA
jgi:hypothetical protein